MDKFMMFNENVRNVFNNEEVKFEAFNKLMIDTAYGKFEEGITPKDANEKIVAKFKAIIGCDEKSTKAEIRKAIRRNQKVLFEVVEDVVEDLLVSGWQDSTFMEEFCDIRNIALAAAYASLSEVYNNYRSRVSDQLGKEVEDKIYHGTKKKKVIEKDENGKEVEKEIDVNENSGSQWSVLYDEHIPNFETRNPQLNLEFLSMTQRMCNQKLIANGYLFLYDVYEALGVTDWINEEQLRGSRIVGWVYDPDDKSRDNFVDFGIMDRNGNYSIEAMQSMRYHTGLWLNFNVDGDILTSKATKNFTKTYKRRY